MPNPFKPAVAELNRQLPDFNNAEKKRLFNQTKMYIFLQELIEKVQPFLVEEETIHGFLPLTSDGSNMAVTNVGLGGLYHAKTEAAKKYIKDFNDLRGNRLMIFTDKRIIFFTIIEFLEEELFYSYPYTTIHSITLQEHKVFYHEFSGFRFTKKQAKSIYYFDFESDNHIFSEMLGESDVAILKKIVEEVPPLKAIGFSEKVYRKSKLDRVFSNFNFAFKALFNLSFYGAIILAVFFIIILLLAIFFSINPLNLPIPKN